MWKFLKSIMQEFTALGGGLFVREALRFFDWSFSSMYHSFCTIGISVIFL